MALPALALALKISSRLIFDAQAATTAMSPPDLFVTHPALLSIQPLQVRKKRTHLEWHLLGSRLQANWFALEHLNPVRPGIDHNSRAERQGSNLIQPIHLQVLAGIGQCLHSDQWLLPKSLLKRPCSRFGNCRRAGAPKLSGRVQHSRVDLYTATSKTARYLSCRRRLPARAIEMEVEVGKDLQNRRRATSNLTRIRRRRE